MALMRANDTHTLTTLREDPAVSINSNWNSYFLIMLPGDSQPNDHMSEQDTVLHATRRHELRYVTSRGDVLSANIYTDQEERLVAIDSTIHDETGRVKKEHVRQTALEQYVHETH